jgi:5,10-methylenetetrahydrofolate reductase
VSAPRIALEITPPREPRLDVLLRRARLLGAAADAVHVIERPGRTSSLDASLALHRAGIPAVWHVATRGRSAASLERDVERARLAGIGAVLCVRGEAGESRDDPPDTPPLHALVSRLRAALPAARIGVTFNPWITLEPARANLLRKLEAGADFVQTQPVFGAAPLAPIGAEIRARFPHVRLWPMVIPLASRAAAEKLALRLRLPTPERVGWDGFAAVAAELAASGFSDGFAVMTLEMDPPAELGAQILAALRGRPRPPDPPC